MLGVVLGGIIADHWGWRAAFGAVGFPGLVMALLFLLVPDYKNVIVKMRPAVKSSDTKAYLHRMYGTLSRGKTLLLVCIAGSFQLIVVSTMWSSVPSFLNRYHGMTASTAAKNAGVLVLCGAVGAVFWGGVADRLARRRSAYKLMMLVGTTSATAALFIFAFSVPLSPSIQNPLILQGGFMMTCTVGVSVSAVLDVTHPELRATGSAVHAFAINLFGLAVGHQVARQARRRDLEKKVLISVRPAGDWWTCQFCAPANEFVAFSNKIRRITRQRQRFTGYHPPTLRGARTCALRWLIWQPNPST